MIHTALPSRIFAVIALFAAVLAFAAESPAASAAAKPEACIAMLQNGIDTKDLALVEQHLDIDSVTAKGAVSVFADKDIAKEAARHPALGLMLALGGNAANNEALISLIASEVREYVEYGVRSGAFAGKPEETQKPYQGLFGKAFRGGAKDRMTFGETKLLRQEGASAIVVTTLTERGKGRAYPLHLRLEQQNAVWRVTEVVNIADFIRLRKEKGKK